MKMFQTIPGTDVQIYFDTATGVLTISGLTEDNEVSQETVDGQEKVTIQL